MATKFAPTWRLRLAMSRDGAVQIDRENLKLGTIATERFAGADRGPSSKLPPTWLRLLVQAQPSKLLSTLGLARRTSLARHGKAILWVWGAGPRDRTSPQVHVDRSTGRIKRLIHGGVDTTFISPAPVGEANGAFLWPAFIEFRFGKNVTRYAVQVVTPLPAGKAPPSPAPSSSE